MLKEASAAKVLDDGQVWMDMLNQRNLLSHTYNFADFAKAVEDIVARYLPAMGRLHKFLEGQLA